MKYSDKNGDSEGSLVDDDDEIRKSIIVPENIEIIRKGTNFRVVMERKLGVDWEHEPEERRDSLFQSLQTNMMIEGYADANMDDSLLERANSLTSSNE